jgi:BirA family biotin operon repressor/biotin-[acetyl-CoA-carboxylase] ligase
MNQIKANMKEHDLKEKILEYFRKSHDKYVSGEDISKALDVSRAYVWKNIDRLREDGYLIDAVPNLGYRLTFAPDKLNVYAVKSELKTKIMGRKVFHFDATTSTNDKAYELAESGEPEGTVVIAESQSHGRGRVGRKWVSPGGGGIYMSVILRPDLEADEIPAITLVAAASVVKTLIRLTGADAKIKWPNDVMINEKKVCGILTEMKAQPDRVDFLVLGIGINVNTPQDKLPDTATSVKSELKKALNRAELVRGFLGQFEKDYILFTKIGFSSLRDECKEFSVVIGRKVKITEHHRTVKGTVLDIDDKGALIVRDEEGKRSRIFSGDVVLCR